MNKYSSYDYLKNINFIICLIITLSLVLTYIILEKSILFNLESLLLIVSQLFALALAPKYIRSSSFKYVYFTYSFIFFFYVIPRLFSYIIFPDTLTFTYGSGGSVRDILINYEMVNKALIIQAVGIVSILSGCLFGDYFFLKNLKQKKTLPEDISTYSVFIIFFLYLLLRFDSAQIFIYENFINNRIVSYYHFHVLIEVLINADVAFIIFLIILYGKSRGFSYEFLPIFILVFIYSLFKAYSASRGGIVFIMMGLIISMIYFDKNPIKIYRLLFLFLFSMAISIFGFGYATQSRDVSPIPGNTATQSRDVSPIPGNTATQSRDVSPIPGNTATQSLGSLDYPYLVTVNKSDSSKFLSIFNRLGAYLDSLVVITNITPNEDLFNTYLNGFYWLKSAINIIVPGVLFSCCLINTSFLPGFIYGYKDVNLLSNPNFYESSFYTIFGLIYVLYGYFFGLILLFMFGIIFSFIINLIIKNNIFRPELILIFCFFSVYMFFIMQGFDAYLADIVKFSFISVLVLAFIYFFDKVLKLSIYFIKKLTQNKRL